MPHPNALRLRRAAFVVAVAALAACATTRDYVPTVKLLLVSGYVTTVQSATLPPDAVIRVQLAEMAHGDAPGQAIANLAFVAGGKAFPQAFSMRYDGADVDKSKSYGLTARAEQGGRVLFATEAQQPVDPFAPGTEIRLLLAPAPAK